MNELEKIERLRSIFAPARGVTVGIGDDCAVLEGGVVWTIDEQVEGTHFRRDLLSLADVGWRSYMAAASDLAAMGASPWCALAALALPADLDDAAFVALAEGQRDAAAKVGASLVGGNLARAERLSIATTLLGKATRPVLRSGARPGDGVFLAGPVGRAAAGLALLLRAAGGADAEIAVDAWRRPVARIEHGLRMASVAHACIDVSDGLARDAAHIAKASGVRIVLDAAAIEADDDVLSRAAAALGVSALDLALGGGEDYALLAAADAPIEGFRRVGEVTEGEGVALRTAQGTQAIEPRGFDHFG